MMDSSPKQQSPPQNGDQNKKKKKQEAQAVADQQKSSSAREDEQVDPQSVTISQKSNGKNSKRNAQDAVGLKEVVIVKEKSKNTTSSHLQQHQSPQRHVNTDQPNSNLQQIQELQNRQQERNINQGERDLRQSRKGQSNGYNEMITFEEASGKKMGHSINPYNSNFANSGQFGISQNNMDRNIGNYVSTLAAVEKANMSVNRTVESEYHTEMNDSETMRNNNTSNMYTRNGATGGPQQGRGGYLDQSQYSGSGQKSQVIGFGLLTLDNDGYHDDQLKTPLNQSVIIENARSVRGAENCARILPLVVMGLIGLWTFIFMVTEISRYSNWNLIQANRPIDVASWHSTDSNMQEAALTYFTGAANNYISLLDFIVQYFIARVMCTVMLTTEYFAIGTGKNFLMALLLLKDVAAIVITLAGGNYTNSAKGWSAFGFYWMSTIGKLSVLMSLQKIFLIRLNYFRMIPAENLSGCSKILKRLGETIYRWAMKRSPHPEAVMIMIFMLIQIPLLLHMAVGLIEGTLILIIWMSVLLFLQLVVWLVFEMCRPKDQSEMFSFTGRLAENLRISVMECREQYWAYLLLLFIIVPGVASCSFSADFMAAIKYHFTGQQLILNYLSIPTSSSEFSFTMTFIGNLLSII